jgi:hypothetical protein
MRTSPMSRETLKDCLDLIDGAEAAMGDLLHKQAVPAIHKLGELRDVLCEALPGGFFGLCETCELPIGCDEDSSTSEDGVTICGDCLKRYSDAA